MAIMCTDPNADPADVVNGLIDLAGNAEHDANPLKAIFGAVYQGNTAPSASTFIEGVVLNNNRDWEIQRVGAECLAEQPFPVNKVAISADFAAGAGSVINETVDNCLQFGGRCFEPLMAVAHVAPAAARPPAAVVAPPRGVNFFPDVETADWLRYRHLSVTDRYYGNRLMLAGTPLRAQRLAVYAADICWRHSDNHQDTVRLAAGNFQFADAVWRFREAFQYSIVLWQILGSVQMITSENPAAPQILTLDPKKDIYVQVNDLRHHHDEHSGAFSLALRVIP